MLKKLIVLFILVLLLSCKNDDSNETPIGKIYFPPLSGLNWQEYSPNSLGWDESKIQNLYNYLDEKDTKGFIILKDGKIVLERYFNGHGKLLKWNWYSAAKTLTSATVGIAQQENLLNIDDKTSDYLGNWTSLVSEKESLITIKHQLSMTTGLDDSNFSSTDLSDLIYLQDAGDRWAYHNGPYTLLQDVVANASNKSFNNYFKDKIANVIGMNGVWFNLGNLHIYRSTTRDMARFGLLIQNKGKWNGIQILNTSFFTEMTTTSQNMNNSYGYLWWLNGKSNFILPRSQEVFNGSMIPNAPDDMLMALGANDQKIYVIPSKNMVVIRVGDEAGDATYSLSSFDNILWEKINQIIE